MIKDIFVPITATAADEGALAHGIALASRLQAHLAVLELVSLPAPAVEQFKADLPAVLDALRQMIESAHTANASALPCEPAMGA